MAMGLLSSMDDDNDFTIFLVDGIMLINTYASPGQWTGHSIVQQIFILCLFCSVISPLSHYDIKECEALSPIPMFHAETGPVQGTDVLARGPPI